MVIVIPHFSHQQPWYKFAFLFWIAILDLAAHESSAPPPPPDHYHFKHRNTP